MYCKNISKTGELKKLRGMSYNTKIKKNLRQKNEINIT